MIDWENRLPQRAWPRKLPAIGKPATEGIAKMAARGTAVKSWQDQFEAAQAARTVNVVCMKWGNRYDAFWVNRLFGMVKRNTTWNVRFVCFTDNAGGIRPEVECQPLPEVTFDKKLGKYWPKLGLMAEGLGGLDGMTLFLDLDVVIIDNIDAFFTHPGRFLIIREWKDPHLGYGNSSILRYFIGQESNVLDKFYATPPEVIVGTYDSKEQNFLTKAVDVASFWPEEWVVPFSIACLPSNRVLRFFTTPIKPVTGKIVVFYGSITPESALRGEHQRNKRVAGGLHLRPTRRRFGRARWISDYWRE
ncbi:MAG: glycosyltransferase [Alphaproteobacteria bacterium]|nr:glycosyltransferase [Alphaproteobacteria bacterium]